MHELPYFLQFTEFCGKYRKPKWNKRETSVIRPSSSSHYCAPLCQWSDTHVFCTNRIYIYIKYFLLFNSV